MDLVYVKGKRDTAEFALTVLVPLLLGALSFLLVKNQAASHMSAVGGGFFSNIVIFPAIWTPILFLKGVASYRMKLAAPKAASHVYYAVSLLVAFVWNLLLFRFGELTYSFVSMIIYLFFLVLTFFEFEKSDKLSGYLMLPALFWGVFLAVLNFLMCKANGIF